ncbi:26S proteasome non-ATPase regulatory subunit 5 [Syncephalis fuscata]|nr:26S proteasome non-ATPase regulatory subunit 5 [Syncephalis fuscata]
MSDQRTFRLQQTVEALSNASNTEEYVDSLQSLKLLLQDRTVTVSTDTINLLFSLLDYEDGYVVELSSSCIALVLAKEDYNQISDLYQSYLIMGIQMPTERVRTLALSQIAKCLASNETVERFLSTPELFELVLGSLADERIGFATQTGVFLSKLADYINGAKAFFRPSAKPILLKLSETNEIVRSRLWDLMVPICCKYRAVFDEFEASGLLKHMVSDISSEDPLLVMNTVHLVANLADTDYALAFLDDEGIIRSITSWALPKEYSAGDRLIVCSALKFLGRIGETHNVKELHEKFSILDAILHQIKSQDSIVKIVAIRTLGLLGRSGSGVEAMYSHGTLRPFIDLVVRSTGELRVPCLESVMMLLEIRGQHDAEKSRYCQLFYTELDAASRPRHAGFLAILVSNTKQAFDDLRYVSYGVIQALSEHRWGRELIVSSTSTINHLLNRDVEPSFEGKKWKFSIIRHLANAPDMDQIVSEATLARLKEYLRQGAYFNQTNVSVAMESST